jgi:glycosyltransferase involved in cell wall biosynthesis
MTARVAVIIPCHDDGAFVGDALASIEEPEPVEIVVVDDGSTDAATLELLARLQREGTRVIRSEENIGVPAARNLGLAGTSAPYVFPLDADDLLVAGSLSAMADRLDADRGAAACFGDYEEFGEPPHSVRKISHVLDPFRIAYQNEFGAPLLRRTALERVGGWLPAGQDGRTFPYEDWHVWMSLAERGERGIHMGDGFVTYRRRIQRGRRLTSDRKRHADSYRLLRSLHPDLFARLAEHRRRSSLSPLRKAVYPLVYGRRSRRGFERRIRVWLDARDIWTQR